MSKLADFFFTRIRRDDFSELGFDVRFNAFNCVGFSVDDYDSNVFRRGGRRADNVSHLKRYFFSLRRRSFAPAIVVVLMLPTRISLRYDRWNHGITNLAVPWLDGLPQQAWPRYN